MLEKTFCPQEAEPRLYKRWQDSGAFAPKMDNRLEPYCIVIPPPNVTGRLHMGHALNNSLQDILIRFERMRGKDVLWQPGTDHAGIATQMVVERQLAEAGERQRLDMQRSEFEALVWAWKARSGGEIVEQLKRLGASCDWSRECFTMGNPDNPGDLMTQAVSRVFVSLYEKGLIYRSKRLVNWDPKFETAISDLEVENRETDGCFWHFKYLLADGQSYEYVEKDADGQVILREQRDYISIATTRPETMLGDGAVAVHPQDERYQPIVGHKVHLPLCDRLIPIITDEYPDPDFGSGAVKITGAHDFNDYEVACRHNIPLYPLMDSRGHMCASEIMPEKYVGLERFEARRAVVADIEAQGLLIKVEDKQIMQPFGDRSGSVIEPMLTDQWFLDTKALAERAQASVTAGQTRFVPENWRKTFDNWMENIQPWCISRQLWWGHRIPVWYDDAGQIYVAESEAQAQAQAGVGVRLHRDEDVLDTWFSSGLWPFSTLGWPDTTPELARFYPGTVLVTAFDIIFFWVARMMMLGLEFMEEVPFRDVYIHALVLDEKGQKMSKSKGNVIDPLEIMDAYGADALRFNMAAQAAQGRNVRLSVSRIEGYRNFGTKLWNAARFSLMHECQRRTDFNPDDCLLAMNQWIVVQARQCAAELTRYLEAYRFNEAAECIYKFSRNLFCDWYLELIKPVLNGTDKAKKTETQAIVAWSLDQILILLHPFMPFITEEIWGKTDMQRDGLLISAAWPDISEDMINVPVTADIDWVISLVSRLRSARAEMSIPPSKKAPLLVIGACPSTLARLDKYDEVLQRMARIESWSVSDVAPKAALRIRVDQVQYVLPLAELIDIEAEHARLLRETRKLQDEMATINTKLSNSAFMERAPEAVVQGQKQRYQTLSETLVSLNKMVDTLSST